MSVVEDNRANLAAFLANDGRGQKLLAYLDQLTSHFATQKETLTGEIEASRSTFCIFRRSSDCSNPMRALMMQTSSSIRAK